MKQMSKSNGKKRVGRISGCGVLCAVLFMPAMVMCGWTLMNAHLNQRGSLPEGLDSAQVDFSGEYVVSLDTSGFNNRGGFTRMPLDQVDRDRSVVVTQSNDAIVFTYTDWKGGRRVDNIRHIGKWRSKWKWVKDGAVGAGLPVRAVNFFMLPGLVYYDQRGSIAQTSNGLVLDYEWNEGGAMFWLLPWEDRPQRTTIILERQEAPSRTIITNIQAASSSANPVVPDSRPQAHVPTAN